MRLRPASVERRDRQRHSERAQIVVVIADPLELRGTQRVRLVEARAELVLFRKAGLLEISGGLKHRQPVAGILRQFGHGNRRQGIADALAFGGVVVEEHEGIETEVDRLRYRLDVGGLVFPIDPEGDDVVFLQDHFGMVAEGIERDGFIVLRGNAQNDSALLQG